MLEDYQVARQSTHRYSIVAGIEKFVQIETVQMMAVGASSRWEAADDSADDSYLSEQCRQNDEETAASDRLVGIGPSQEI